MKKREDGQLLDFWCEHAGGMVVSFTEMGS